MDLCRSTCRTRPRMAGRCWHLIGRPLLTGAGMPILLAARWLCLFGDTPPSEVVVGVEFRISFSVSVMP